MPQVQIAFHVATKEAALRKLAETQADTPALDRLRQMVVSALDELEPKGEHSVRVVAHAHVDRTMFKAQVEVSLSEPLAG